MKLLKFSTLDEYTRIQSETNEAKLDWVAATTAEMDFIAQQVRRWNPEAQFGICHGVRNGWEVEQLRQRLGVDVIGTDISPTAEQFPHCVQWDFHEVKPEWVGAVDFIYSNALDHSYDPALALQRWKSCLTGKGIVFLQWTHHHNETGGADCFGASLREYVAMLGEHFDVVESFNTYSLRRRWREQLRGWVRRVPVRRCYVLTCRQR